jgi:hypothetical protein
VGIIYTSLILQEEEVSTGLKTTFEANFVLQRTRNQSSVAYLSMHNRVPRITGIRLKTICQLLSFGACLAKNARAA